MVESSLKGLKTLGGKEEIARNGQFLCFPKVFPKDLY